MKNWFRIILDILLGVSLGILFTLAVAGKSMRNHIPSARGEWSKLNLVLDAISSNYVDSVDTEAITVAAIESALHKLDPHTVYLPPAQLEESETDLLGNFDGIGIQFNVPNDTAIVLEVIPGGPSEKIGLMKGDRLLKVDDTDIAGVKFPQDSMVRRMKGPAGTKVLVTVLRDREVIPFEITRGKIPVNSIDAAFMMNDTTGYVRLSKFARTTATEFVKATLELKEQGMTRLIFDLRDNTGGYFDQALILSNIFLEKGRDIVYTQGLHREKEAYKADGKGYLIDLPLTVLIDEGSASSSEIFAGAIQDNDRGVIIGRRSFGKGLVQEPLYFSDGSGIRLTIARFYTPSGRCIQKPYSEDEDYEQDLLERYMDGEMLAADSIKVNLDEEFKTVGGRSVYGGGGIVPDVFVPIDTTRVTQFYINLVKKATAMRFASAFFDAHKAELSQIDDYGQLLSYLDNASLEAGFLEYARTRDGLKPSSEAEWRETEPYMMVQVRALVGRFSNLGDKAYYHIYSTIDTVIEESLKEHKIL